MKDTFDRAISELFKHEGGYSNHPNDPGGETKFGISKRSYPKEDIKNLTIDRAKEIYRRDFWNVVRCDDLPAGLDLVVFDAAVNSGPAQSVKWLQRTLGVSADGKVGPVTLEAARLAPARDAIVGSCRLRLEFLRELDTWPTFGAGWAHRVEKVKISGLVLAQRPMPRPVPPPSAWDTWRRIWRDILAAFGR